MLILTRKEGQSIRIGENIVIKIVAIDGGQVKIGIDAPKGVAIFREELYEKLKESNIEALKTSKEVSFEELISKIPKDDEKTDFEKTKKDKRIFKEEKKE